MHRKCHHTLGERERENLSGAPCRCHVRIHRRTNNQPTNTNLQSISTSHQNSDLTLRLHHLQTAGFTEKLQGPLRSLRQGPSLVPPSEPCLTPCRTSERRGSLISLPCHTIPPAHARELTGLPQTSMTDDPEPRKHSRCLSDPCAQDHHTYHRGILDTVTENFRAQQ